MKQTLSIALVLAAAASLSACKKKEENKPADPAAKPADPAAKPADPAAKPADPVPTPTPTPTAPAANLVEVDLSPFGDAFKGYVAMAPAGTKVEFDDPSRQLIISDTDFVSVSEAPGYADAVKSLGTDPDNSEIKVVSDTEARWMRNPPLGKQWNFDVKVDVGGAPYSCSGGTFTDAAMADTLVNVCKSIKKK